MTVCHMPFSCMLQISHNSSAATACAEAVHSMKLTRCKLQVQTYAWTVLDGSASLAAQQVCACSACAASKSLSSYTSTWLFVRKLAIQTPCMLPVRLVHSIRCCISTGGFRITATHLPLHQLVFLQGGLWPGPVAEGCCYPALTPAATPAAPEY